MSRLSLLYTVLTLRLRGEREPGEGTPGASPGQVLVLFALMSTALFGILGLSVDVGYAVSQRRSMQNAADLAAIAGAHSVAEYRQDNVVSASTSVQAVVDGNQTREGSPAIEACDYVNDDLQSVANCDFAVPADATGVRVQTTETHDTFFIHIVPGAPRQVTTNARATARVELLFRAGIDSPFLICGYGTVLADGSGTMDILLNDRTVNPEAIGQTFRIVGDNVARPPADTDGDGLTDDDSTAVDEAGLGTDPLVFDTDGGGIADGAEVALGTDPNNGADDVRTHDTDGDGLTDAEEADLGTDPDGWDTDSDQLSDWAEAKTYDTDPRVQDDDEAGDDLRDDDSDGDGRKDDDETALGTDPDGRDSDGGGLEDGAEIAKGTDPEDGADDVRSHDRDGDGLTDAEEAGFDTDPFVTDTDGGGVSDWAEAIDNATAPLVPGDDNGSGVDEIANCGLKIADTSGDYLEEVGDLDRFYNAKDARTWWGFAHNKRSDNPNNDDHLEGETWWGRKGKSAPATQRFTVDGVDGCYGQNQSDYPAVNANNFNNSIEDNCILAIPVFSDAENSGVQPYCPTAGVSPCEYHVAKVLAFKVAKIGNTHYEARLLDDYPAFGGSFPGWSRDSGGTVVIKLKE